MERVARAHAAEFETNGDFVFSMSAQDCEIITGLTRSQQAGCRRALIAAELISEQSEQRRTVVYRLHLNRIARALIAQSAPLAEKLVNYEPLPQIPATFARQA
jgi:hypothetical protein